MARRSRLAMVGVIALLGGAAGAAPPDSTGGPPEQARAAQPDLPDRASDRAQEAHAQRPWSDPWGACIETAEDALACDEAGGIGVSDASCPGELQADWSYVGGNQAGCEAEGGVWEADTGACVFYIELPGLQCLPVEPYDADALAASLVALGVYDAAPVTAPQTGRVLVAFTMSDGDPVAQQRFTDECLRYSGRFADTRTDPSGGNGDRYAQLCVPAELGLAEHVQVTLSAAPNVCGGGQMVVLGHTWPAEDYVSLEAFCE